MHRLFFFLYFLSSHSFAQEDVEWSLQKSNDGIDVYTKVSPDSKFKSIKAITSFDFPLKTIVGVITDADSHYKWINNCTESKLLKASGDTSIIFYEYYHLPWPASDRDIVIETKIEYKDPKSVTLTSKARPDYIAEKDGVVRIQEFAGSWGLSLQPDSRIRGIYIAMVNPGGYLPAWLVNLFIINGPYDSFVNMKKRLADK